MKLISFNPVLICLILTILFLSCKPSSRLRKLYSNESSGTYHLSFDATRRGVFIQTDHKSNKTKIISEVSPDAIVNVISELNNSLKIKDIGETSQKLSYAENVVALGKRTVAVNILRDALFRLEEMNVNNESIDPKLLDLFKEVLSVAKEIALSEKTAEETNKLKAEESKNKSEESLLLQKTNKKQIQ